MTITVLSKILLILMIVLTIITIGVQIRTVVINIQNDIEKHKINKVIKELETVAKPKRHVKRTIGNILRPIKIKIKCNIKAIVFKFKSYKRGLKKRICKYLSEEQQ